MRIDRSPADIARSRGCVDGPRRPLYAIMEDNEGSRTPTAPIGDAPAVAGFPVGDYRTVDGERVGFSELLWPRAFDEHYSEEPRDGGAEVVWRMPETAVAAYHGTPASDLRFEFLLLSVGNTEFDSNNSCWAKYGNFRLNVAYDFAPF